MLTQTLQRRLALTLLSITLIVALFVPVQTAKAQGFLVNFGGYMLNVDYETCTCGFIIFTVYDKAKHMEYRIIYFYLLNLLEKLGVSFPDWLSMGIPRIYAQYAIWPGSDANVLGNFIPYAGASCWMISNTGCSQVSNAGDGYLLNMGTSFTGSF